MSQGALEVNVPYVGGQPELERTFLLETVMIALLESDTEPFNF